MFPTQSKVTRKRTNPWWLLPTVALALFLVAFGGFAATPADAQTLPGDYCIEGLVIDWKEEPLADWEITLEGNLLQGPLVTYSADADNDDWDEGEFGFDADDGIPQEPGVYTATITLQDGWEGVTPTTITFPIEVGSDGCAQIRFKVRPLITVEVIKFDVNHVGLEGWVIDAVPGRGNLFASAKQEETDENGIATFELTPGNWIFSEKPGEWDMESPRESYMPVVPPSGRQEIRLTEDMINGDPIQIVFKNELMTGCIAVQKVGLMGEAEVVGASKGGLAANQTVWTGSYNVAGWGFTLLRKDGSVARQGVTDATGRLEFDNLPLGPYRIVEENRAGWTETVSREYDVVVDGNACDDLVDGEPYPEAIVFENVQDDSGWCIQGRKVDANGGYGLPGWEIKIRPLAAGGYDPGNTETDGLGNFTFNFPRNDYRVPGAKYEICEEDQDGWLPHTATCQTVTLPEWPSGECVVLSDFVNQQVGHSESEAGWGNNPGGGWMPAPANCSRYHTVKAGEGLFDIGAQYGKSAQQMLNANPSVRANANYWIYVGQQLCIP